jgi:class 3 adenylate cyclase
MAGIEELLRRRAEMLESIDREILAGYTRPVTLLFTDIVGSTRYYERMGDIAGRQMVQTHNDLLFPLIEAAGGKVIKTIGDSIMASFEDPVRAVRSAMDMQKALQAHNTSPSAAHKFHVRMGLHHGRAVVDERDLFGDMVNTAARVEAQAEGDEILVSGQLEEKLGGSGIPLVLLGEELVNGKEEKVRFWLVNWEQKPEEDVRSQWERRRRQQPASDAPSAPAPRAGAVAASTAAAASILVSRRPDPQAELAAQKPLPTRGNPYLNRVMLPHPDMFYGRKALVKRLMSRISGQSPQSISLVGERRMGKSSLLNFLRSPQTRLGLLEQPDSCLFILIDFQQTRGLDQGQFFSIVFAEARRQLGGILELNSPADDDGMRMLCEAVKGAGLKLVFLFDEFECVTRNDKLKPEFYSFLRSLANTWPVGFITASGRELKQMCASHEISDSPFFNIFSVQHLGLFTLDEARALVTEPSAARGIPLAPVAQTILEQAGLHPFFLQIACSAWFEHLEAEGAPADELADKAVPREVAEAFRDEARPHFEFILENLGDDEKAALRACIQNGVVAEETPGAAALEKKGWLARQPSGLTPFGGEFRRFLEKNLG